MAQVAGAALLHPEGSGPPQGPVQRPQRRRHPRATVIHVHKSPAAASATATGSDVKPRPQTAAMSRVALSGGHLGRWRVGRAGRPSWGGNGRGTAMMSVSDHGGATRPERVSLPLSLTPVGPCCHPEMRKESSDLKSSGTKQEPEAMLGLERPGQKQAVWGRECSAGPIQSTTC